MWCTTECLKCEDKDCEHYMTRTEKIQTQYLKFIINLGYDYDGFDTVEDLKNLIDELIRYAKLGLEKNDKEIIYINNKLKFNILGEQIK